jgi:copper chaperone CopZ
MKNLLKLLSLVMILSISLTTNAKDKKEIKEVTYVTSVDCNHCKMTIMKNIPYEKGVKDVKVDVPTKEVTVKYLADKNSEDKLADAIVKLGYTVKVKNAEESKKPCCAPAKAGEKK